jgi:hypothetical protein
MSDELEERVRTVADEAFGPFPVDVLDDHLARIERGVFAAKAEREKLEAEVKRLKGELADAKAEAAGNQQWADLWCDQSRDWQDQAIEAEKAREDAIRVLIGVSSERDEAVALIGQYQARIELLDRLTEQEKPLHAIIDALRTLNLGGDQLLYWIERDLNAGHPTAARVHLNFVDELLRVAAKGSGE